ncbi:regulator of DNA class I crossover intermediates 1 [Glossophaga mutica]
MTLKGTRVLIKQEKRKQREYFEKKRLRSKMKSLGVLSPVKNSTVSLDLLNLYVVNQISRQKKIPETVRKPTHVNMNRDIKMPLRKHDLELPMSPPRVPSNLCIDDIENKSSIPLEELHSKKSWDFGLGKNLMEEEGLHSVKVMPTSTKKIDIAEFLVAPSGSSTRNGLESSQSGQSSGYSPRPTDSCFSSSSEMLSEDEDQALQQTEDSSRRSTKPEDTTNNFHLERMAGFPHDRSIKDNTRIHKPSQSLDQFSVKDTAHQLTQSQSNSAHMLQSKTSADCRLQCVRHDAWVQTECAPVMRDRLDAAIQCNIISECKCRSDVSSLCSVDRCSEDIKADTTGGQEILKNN